jgi:hypothetical protein
MEPEANLAGRRFGKLVAQERLYKADRGWRWRCVCDCGQIVIAHEYTLWKGTTSQCWRCIQKSIKGRCEVCGQQAWARGRCHNHYLQWRSENVPGSKEKRLHAIRERHEQRVREEGTEWKVEKNRKARIGIPDWYVRQCHKLPADASPEVIEEHRKEILAKRAERKAAGVRGPGAPRRVPNFIH